MHHCLLALPVKDEMINVFNEQVYDKICAQHGLLPFSILNKNNDWMYLEGMTRFLYYPPNMMLVTKLSNHPNYCVAWHLLNILKIPAKDKCFEDDTFF